MHQIELKRVNAHLVDIQIKSDYCSVLSNAGVFLQTVYIQATPTAALRQSLRF